MSDLYSHYFASVKCFESSSYENSNYPSEVLASRCPEHWNTNLKIWEDILCRSCGNPVSSSSFLIAEISPDATHSFNTTAFDKHIVLVQVLSNDILRFPVVTLSHTNCVIVGEWEEDDSWFPGYRWKPCVCPECGNYIGWLFERTNTDIDRRPYFYGLILSNLLDEACNYMNE